MKKITLLISCKDKPGIIANVTDFISKNKGNITYVDQHVDTEQDVFFMRLECEFKNLDSKSFTLRFENNLSKPFALTWEIYTHNETLPKMAVFVSKYDHCLYDILGRYKSQELKVNIPFIISNHDILKPIADSFKIPFYHIPVTKTIKVEAEKMQLRLLKQHNVDFIVLARYMQIITGKLIEQFPNNIINIHHSFLPAFVGAKPYHSAFKRGVKIIGATSHYVTEDLDAGPIIEQDVARVSHTFNIKDLIAKGRDLEKIVLANAIKQHLNRKVMVNNNKTIIFS
ncbi:formyltetrahydrofolate deformylase [Winogradskyella sp.]|uniref:formyltetrahydrofolate deformylase n=1 Tax=Winogradskyella sp. TaxID=1883156 RepID=UPI0025D4B998|nr:formyltetrahydrofolate deformylase [Winogradskyella sp.]MBT8245198.1 formyltetrahydrofolate deformylase [Winogradskyella sp.]